MDDLPAIAHKRSLDQFNFTSFLLSRVNSASQLPSSPVLLDFVVLVFFYSFFIQTQASLDFWFLIFLKPKN